MNACRAGRFVWMVAAILFASQACSQTAPSRPIVRPPDSPAPPAPGGGSQGTHTVSWAIDDACPAIPAEAKERSFDATIESGLVTLRTGVFLEGLVCTIGTGLGCNQFKMTQDGDSAAIYIGNDGEWHGGQIVERLPSGTWYELIASGVGRTEGSKIEATLKGDLWYCPNNVSYPFPCPQFVGCGLNSLRMTIAKKDE